MIHVLYSLLSATGIHVVGFFTRTMHTCHALSFLRICRNCSHSSALYGKVDINDVSRSGVLVRSSSAFGVTSAPTSSSLHEYTNQLVLEARRYRAVREVLAMFPVLLLQQEFCPQRA